MTDTHLSSVCLVTQAALDEHLSVGAGALLHPFVSHTQPEASNELHGLPFTLPRCVLNDGVAVTGCIKQRGTATSSYSQPARNADCGPLPFALPIF